MKILKWVGIGIAGLVLLAVVAVGVFLATFDPNRYKAQVEATVKERTGRTLRLEGELKVAIFPSLGASVGRASLSERDSNDPFVTVESAHGSLAVMPLLRGQAIVDRVRVAGLQANVVKDKSGRFNFADLLEHKDKPAAKPDPKKADEGGRAVAFDIAGVSVERSGVRYRDLQKGQTLEISELKLETGRIAGKAEGKLVLGARVKGSQPVLDATVALSGNYDLDLPQKKYSLAKVDGAIKGTLGKDALELTLAAPRLDVGAENASGEALTASFSLKGARRTVQADLKAAGVQGSAKALSIPQLNANVLLAGPDMPRELKIPLQGSLRADLEKETAGADLSSKFDESAIQAKLGLAKFSPPSYLFDVNVDRLNLDQYFPPKPKAAPTTPEGKAEKKASPGRPQEDTPVDLSAIKDLSANGKLAVGALQVQGLKLANVRAEFKAANGRLDVAPHSANLYDGAVSGAISAMANGNRIVVKETLTNVSIGPLLRDFAQQDRLEGRGNLSLDVAGAGATVNAIKRSLDGSAKVNLRDGALKGIDIGAMLQKVRSLGGRSEQGAADNRQKTDFTELNATFSIKNGVATNKDLDIKAPLVRVAGAGDIDIGHSKLDYTAKASVVATGKGQGGKGVEQLSGVTIPVRLVGPFDGLEYKVDYGAAAADLARTKIGEKVQERIQERIGGKAGESAQDKVQDKVRDRLKGLMGR